MDILRAILLSLEAMIEDPELQVNGFVLIIDWSNFTFKQASKLTPSMLRLAIEGLQVREPFKGHNCLLSTVNYIRCHSRQNLVFGKKGA